MLHTPLNVIGVIHGVNSLLHEPVVNNVYIVSWTTVEGGTSVSQLS